MLECFSLTFLDSRLAFVAKEISGSVLLQDGDMSLKFSQKSIFLILDSLFIHTFCVSICMFLTFPQIQARTQLNCIGGTDVEAELKVKK